MVDAGEEPSISIAKSDVYGPYAALECSKHFPLLYSGKGALLCVHSLDGQLLHAIQPFDAQNIHGIREIGCTGNVMELLVFSDKYIRHIAFHYSPEDEISSEILNRFQLFDDFIWDCALVNNKQHLVVGFAHNRVHVYRISDFSAGSSDGNPELQLLGDVRSTPQCVLYCMNLCTAASVDASNQQHMLIASGTCFHDVTLWHMTEWANAEVKCVLKGHQGVVFRMRFCEETMTLLTVSDDRTARLWSVEDGQELAVFWGHTDRVWDAIFCGEHIVTSSEDSTVKVWTRDGTCLATLCGHSDDAWRLATRTLPDGNQIVYSAGADGSIKVWPVEYHLQNSAQEPRLLSIPLPVAPRQPVDTQIVEERKQGLEVSDETTEMAIADAAADMGESSIDDTLEDVSEGNQRKNPQSKKKQKKQGGSTAHRQSTICSIKIAPNTAEMVICVNDGAVWRCRGADTLHDLQYVWTDVSPRLEVEAAPLFEPIGAFNASWTRQWMMVAHPSGVVSLCSLENGEVLHRWQPHARRTLNMWLFENESCADKCLLVTSSSDSTCAIWELRDQQQPELLATVQMEKGEDATAACFVDDLLVVGDKVGNLHVVDLQQLSKTDAAPSIAPRQTLRRVHGRDIVSSIVALPTRSAIASLGHDGGMVQCMFQARTLCLQDRLATHPISVPETLWTIGNSFVVGGWHGSHFMIWDLVNRYQFLKTDGGSWRRCHSSSLSGNPAFPLPFFICSLPRKGEISLSIHRVAGRQLAVPSQFCFHSSGHGKPVLCSAWINPVADCPEQSLLVTAGQDGRVLVWQTPQRDRCGEYLSLRHPLAGHITIMRALAVSSPASPTGLLAAGGGKLSMNLWRYQPNERGEVQFMFVAQHCLWKKATQDHRIFCLQAMPHPFQPHPQDGKDVVRDFWVIAGDSRSILTICQLDAASGECTTLNELSFDGYPLLCCRSLKLSTTAAAIVLTVVGTTNGDLHLALCGVHREGQDFGSCRLLETITAHQMGANCVDVRISGCSEDESSVQWSLSILSGGDDQAIAVSQVQVSLDLPSLNVSCRHVLTEIVADSSGSAVKSVVLTQGGDHCVSVGYDQRLTVWRLKLPDLASLGDEKATPQGQYRRTQRHASDCLQYAAATVVNVGDISGLSLGEEMHSVTGGVSEMDENGSRFGLFTQVLITGQGMQLGRITFSRPQGR